VTPGPKLSPCYRQQITGQFQAGQKGGFMVARMFVLLAFVLCCSINHAEEAVEISLNEIWAYEMPGTKDVRELEPEVYGELTKSLPSEERAERLKKSIIQSIRNSLELEPDIDKSASHESRKGFVVEGNGKKALHETNAMLAGAKELRVTFASGSNLVLVFYSLQMSVYVHLTSVTLDGNQIEIHFRFVPHYTDEMSSHFALIPLGKRSKGQYRVTIVEDAMKDYKAWGVGEFNPKWREKYVCKDFEFTVQGEQERE
jgi:hypothetical protein